MEGWVEECRDEETEMGGWMEYPYFWMDAMIFLSLFLVFFPPTITSCHRFLLSWYNDDI